MLVLDVLLLLLFLLLYSIFLVVALFVVGVRCSFVLVAQAELMAWFLLGDFRDEISRTLKRQKTRDSGRGHDPRL